MPPENSVKSALGQPLRERGGIALDLLLVVGKARRQRFVQGDSLRRDHMHQRPALRAGEDRRVNRFGIRLVTHDQSAARAAQGLVRRRGDNMRMTDRRRVLPSGNQPGDMGDIGQKQRAHFVRDGPQAREINDARVRRRARRDHLRLHLTGDARAFVVVDPPCLSVHAVKLRVVELAGEVDGGAMCQMPALIEPHA